MLPCRPCLTSAALLTLSVALSVALTSCAISPLPQPVSAGIGAAHAIRGGVHGGQQPVSGSTIQLWAVGILGDASAATPLFTRTVLTDANGAFEFGGAFTCPSANRLVYITARGGNPGLPGNINNAALGEMALIGPCGSINNNTFLNINELTTTAAAAALESGHGSFYRGDYTAIGTDPATYTDLIALFATAQAYVNIQTGQIPGPNLLPNQSFDVPQFNTFADLLSGCVNNTGDLSTPTTYCSMLFNSAEIEFAGVGPTGYSLPTNTIDAAFNLIYKGNTGYPFLPPLPPYPPFQPTEAIPGGWTLDIATPRSPSVASPSVSLSPGEGIPGPQTVTITDSTPGAVLTYSVVEQNSIYGYTQDAYPLQPYTGPFTVTPYALISVQASAPGYSTAFGGLTVYGYGSPAPPPVITPPGGVFAGAASPLLDERLIAVQGDFYKPTIYYTLDGSLPTTSSPSCTVSCQVTLTASGTVTAVADFINYSPGTSYPLSAPSRATFTVYGALVPPLTFSPVPNVYTGPQSVAISAPGASTIHYTVDGSAPTTSSPVYTGPIPITTSATINILAVSAASTQSVSEASYIIAAPGNYGIISSVPGLMLGPLNGIGDQPAGGLAIDRANNLDVSNPYLNTINQVTPAGAITRIVDVLGLGSYGGVGGPAVDAYILPGAIALDHAGNLYLSQGSPNYSGSFISKVTKANGILTTVVGHFPPALGAPTPPDFGDGSPASNAVLSDVTALASDAAGNLYIADSSESRIRKLEVATGVISTVAGTIPGFSGDGGPATGARLNHPQGLAIDPAGNLYISDLLNMRIRRVDALTGIITTVAGQTTNPYFLGMNGPALNAYLDSPGGLAFGPSGDLYVITGNYVRRISPSGIISPVVGGGYGPTPGDNGDGSYAFNINLVNPISLTVDSLGNLYIAESATGLIRKVVF